jgi:hypothetical protein
MVLFRAPDVRSALNVFAGMIGLHGLGLPAGLAEVTGMSGLGPMTLLDGEVPTKTFAAAVGYLVALLAIALLLPNSLQVLSKHDPALHMPKRPSELIGVGAIIWRPTLPWMAFTAVLAALAMMQLTGKSEFLYWQF